jgi:hypothetical protein
MKDEITEPVFRLWGTMAANVGGKALNLPQPRERRLLAGLLAAKGTWIAREPLCQWIWDDQPDTFEA